MAQLFLGVSVRLNLTAEPCQGFAPLRVEYHTRFAAFLVPHAITLTGAISPVRLERYLSRIWRLKWQL